MKINDIVNIKSSDGEYWKGKIIEISYKWEHKLKTGEVLSHTYSNPIATINQINGIGYAVKIEKDLRLKDNEYWEK